MDKSRVEPTIFFIEKISFSLKLFSGHFYGQSVIKTVPGPLIILCLYGDTLHYLEILHASLTFLFFTNNNVEGEDFAPVKCILAPLA